MNSTASKLDELIGLEGAKRALLRLCESEAGVHAVLFYGARGAGKSILANALAQAWLCTDSSVQGACGVCAACASFERNGGADTLRIQPLGKSNLITRREGEADDGKPRIDSIDGFLRTRPLMARTKVVIIEDADRMIEVASNTVLKTLEEPPPYAKLILTSSAIGHIRPTILSRCFAVACELPRAQERSPVPMTDESWLLAEGAPGRARTLGEDAELYGQLRRFATGLASRKPGEALAAADEFRQICENIENKLELGARASNAEGLELLAIAIQNSNPEWSTALSALVEAHRRIIRNGNSGIVFDTLFATMLAGS